IKLTTSLDDNDSIYKIAIGAILGGYKFDKYKSKKTDDHIDIIYISTPSQKDFSETIKKAIKIANSTNFTRDVVNMAPDDCYPKVLAKIAKDLADENDLECNILKQKHIEKENMNALLAVARASRHDPRVIHLAHKPKNAKYKVLVIGKGLTYDSGGLSLKPSDFMTTMKADKSGACAVLGIMKSASELNMDIEVHGFIGAVENMIGGDSYKPDDVLTAKNGKTIEVKNTDAEGRLVLADVLDFAQQEIPDFDYIIDLATLTGACVVGVGNYTTGIMGHNENLKNKMKECAKRSGEFATPLDFNRFLAKTLKNETADICNISNTRYGGALTAGLFLSEFIKDENKDKWLHLDIAGPAYVEHIWGVNPYGASGAGVRMVVEFLESL
ncbi:MAG: leucyl aminopeptidase, partial [Epsilonproteobacteria bacterium]|nr:leucyl aminopeptidase [Campylobacterota bacterium]